jgi:hypothetical protein
MLGKAVKIRHCPATVSAPGPTHVTTPTTKDLPSEVPCIDLGEQQDHWKVPGRSLNEDFNGQPLEISAMAQVRRPVLDA